MRQRRVLALQLVALALVGLSIIAPAYSLRIDIPSIVSDILGSSRTVPTGVVGPVPAGGTNQVATDSAGAFTSLATVGGHNLLQDASGKYLVVYVDTAGRLGVVYSNGDPLRVGWSSPVKSSAPSTAYSRPAAILAAPNTLKIIAMGGTGVGNIVDVTANVQRDLLGNIVGVSFASPVTLDTGSQHPAATQLHDGSLVAVWNSRQAGVFSIVNALRWSVADGWRSPSDRGSTIPDSPIVDTVNNAAIFPSVIQRRDDLQLYIVGNRGETSTQTNMVFNSAVFTGFGWRWGVQNLAYETNVSRGSADTPDLVWDSRRSAVVILYDITFRNQYGVLIVSTSGIKVHVDVPPLVGIGQDQKDYQGTPELDTTNNEWGSLQVDPRTGDYYLFTIDTAVGQSMGAVGYTKYSGGVWQTTLTIVDADMDNMGTEPKRVSGPGLVVGRLGPLSTRGIEFLYCQGSTSPSVLTFARLDTS